MLALLSAPGYFRHIVEPYLNRESISLTPNRSGVRIPVSIEGLIDRTGGAILGALFMMLGSVIDVA
jgi:hypothetical protein